MNLLALSLIGFAPVIYFLKSLVVIKCIKETPTEPGRATSIEAMCCLGMGQNKNTCSNMWESVRF